MKCQRWNDDWKFWDEQNAFALVWNVPEHARTVTLPHDAMLERSPRADSPNGNDTGFRDGGNYVYVKQFFAPEEWRAQTVQVQFEAVYMNALVYLNGNLVGKRPYGYSPFTISLNDYLNYGGQNELRVLVKNNGMPNSRWYSGSGISRDVWLRTAPTVYLPEEGLRVTTRAIEAEYAVLELSAVIKNRSHLPRHVRLTLEITDPDGRIAAHAEHPLTVISGSDETLKQTVTVDAPALWSAEHPHLYRCRAVLTDGEDVLDQTDTQFGIRTLALDAKQGFRVNGESVKLRGACIHHDNGLLGAVSCDEAELRRVSILKQAGFNAIRMAHNPASVPLLRACDKLGMYVMDESFDMWSRPKKDCDYSLFIDKWWQEDLSALVEKDFNHPCVVFYSLGNEIPECGLPQGSAFGREMDRFVKAMDPTRFTLLSVNGVFAAGDQVDTIVADIMAGGAGSTDGNVNDFMTIMDTKMDDIVVHPIMSDRLEHIAPCADILGYNYMTARYAPDAQKYPHRIMVGSETYPPDIARNWALVKQLPSLIGDFTWTGWDYIGEAGVGVPAYRFGEGGFGAQFPCQLAFCGDIDLTGFRRSASYFREVVFGLRRAPYITVQDPAHYGQHLIKTPWVISDSHSTWTWPGFEGKPVVVELYAPGDEVELFQDGVSLGRKPCGEAAGFLTHFETVFRPGRLEAVAYEQGAELGRMELTSAGALHALSLEAEPSEGGLVYVNITLLDEAGRVINSDMELTAAVTGGALAGFGSGDPKPTHNYIESVTNTFHGRALAILRRSGCEAVSLTVSGGGLTKIITI